MTAHPAGMVNFPWFFIRFYAGMVTPIYHMV